MRNEIYKGQKTKIILSGYNNSKSSL